MHFLNSQPFLEFLCILTGINTLLPDPYFEGGGAHQIMPGGHLKIHADFNKHILTNLDRRLNVLIYLNKDWEESWGGHLEFWDKELKSPVKKILPIFNRMAIFTTTSTSYHGHPDPLKCPASDAGNHWHCITIQTAAPKRRMPRDSRYTELYGKRDRPRSVRILSRLP
jgi:hypothetical protein